MLISVFGSKIYKKDMDLLALVPKLRKLFPRHKFIIQDPTEDLRIPENKWIIVDKAEGIDKITVFENLNNFVSTRSLTVHDYDLYMELKLQEKIRKLPKMRIITVPLQQKAEKFEKKLAEAVRSELACLDR